MSRFEFPTRGFNGYEVTLFGWTFFRWHAKGIRTLGIIPGKRWHVYRSDS